VSAEWRHVEELDHISIAGYGLGLCDLDKQPWPCDAEKMRVERDAAIRRAARLVKDFDPFDYEQGLCYWCQGGWEDVLGPRGGKPKAVHTGKHKPGCAFAEAVEGSGQGG
jgi:hypothetical protein